MKVITDQQIDELVDDGIRTFLQVRQERLLMGYFSYSDEREFAWRAIATEKRQYMIDVALNCMSIESGDLITTYLGELADFSLADKIRMAVTDFRQTFVAGQ